MADGRSDAPSEEFDIIIVGAGISGIGAGYFLQTQCEKKSYAILESRDSLGGTWDLFRYPGVRSDSDMHTLGFSFKPWTNPKSIADGPSILSYLRETAAEFGIDRHMQFGKTVTHAAWSSEQALWILTVADSQGTRFTYRCSFLFVCAGYYDYADGYRPVFEGEEDFNGTIVHPQRWPADLDYDNKKVVVIGSGATAVTLVPAMAVDAAEVTMLQRSPSYVVARPESDAIANRLRRFLPDKLAYQLTRRKNIALGQFFYDQTRKNPEKIKAKLLDGVQDALGQGYDIEQHFTPTYNPWDQRLCLVPGGDLFEAINNGSASVLTDAIVRFTETGIDLESGTHIDADVIVTATGLQLVTLGQIEIEVDGEVIDFSQTWTYKGLAYSDVPNLVSSFGYINASWTLRSDMTGEYVTRLINHMDATGTDQCTPRLRDSDADMPTRPWIDDFSSGYMKRMMPEMPRQGDRAPWLNPQRYGPDVKMIKKGSVDDGVMTFTRAPAKLIFERPNAASRRP